MSFAKLKRLVEEGDTIILYVGLSQIYAIEVKPTVKNKHGVMVEYTFQTKYGALRVMDLVGKEFGSKVQLSRGYAYVLYPTPELWTLTLPHRTQILYTPDIALIITELDIRAGSVVCEAGTGSGSLSHAILRTIGPKGHLYTCDFHQERADVVRIEFEKHGHSSSVTVEARDVCENGWGRSDIADAVFLDLPKPWEALTHAIDAICPSGGRICSFSPCVEQVSRSCEMMRSLGLTEINTLECLQREFQFRSMSLPPVEVKKVESPLLNPGRQNAIESASKKQKLSTEYTGDSCVIPDSEDSVKNQKDIEDDYTPTTSKDCKFRTAIPLLKMQGHTGFLTFATVPPRLKLRAKSTVKLEEGLDNSASSGYPSPSLSSPAVKSVLTMSPSLPASSSVQSTSEVLQ